MTSQDLYHPPGNLSDTPLTRIPWRLHIVAAFFILTGISACYNVISGLIQGSVNIDITILNLFAGFGLLKGSPGWHKYTKFILVLCLCVLPIVVVLLLIFSGSAINNNTGQPAGPGLIALSTAVLTAFWLFFLWQYKVLISPDILPIFTTRRNYPLHADAASRRQ